MANEHIFKSNVIVTGSIETSTGFVGDGSGLTGITSTTAWDGNLNGDASITGSLVVSSSTATVDFQDTAGVSGSFSGSYEGNGSNLTNLNINNVTATGVNLSGTFTGNGSALTGLDPFPYYGDAKITGSLTVSSSVVDFTDSIAISGSTFSGSFVGDGTGLSGLTASPAGANTEIQLNNSGTTGASSNLKYDGSTLIVSESIRIIKSGSGEIEITNNSGTPNVSLLKARGSGGTNMGTFLFQGSTPYGTTSDYMTLSSAVLDVTGALIKGGKLSVGGYPVTTPTTAQGNLYVKRSTSTGGASSDTVATFINSDSGAYGGGGFIDIVGNSNDYASGGIQVKNGTHIDGEIYYTGGSRQIILHTNKRGISLNSSGLLYKNNNSTQLAINHDGDIGIGTTTPGNKLHIEGSESTVYSPTDSGGQESVGTAIINKNLAGNTNNFSQLLFTVGTNNNSVSRIVAIRSASDASDLAFVGKSAAGAAEYMRIKSGGNVGIGTSSPQAKLDVSSTTDGFLPPRLSSTQMYNISSPPAGLMIWNTVVQKLCVYNGSNWQSLDATTLPSLQEPEP